MHCSADLRGAGKRNNTADFRSDRTYGIEGETSPFKTDESLEGAEERSSLRYENGNETWDAARDTRDKGNATSQMENISPSSLLIAPICTERDREEQLLNYLL